MSHTRYGREELLLLVENVERLDCAHVGRGFVPEVPIILPKRSASLEVFSLVVRPAFLSLTDACTGFLPQSL
jgi:hypothetical protein